MSVYKRNGKFYCRFQIDGERHHFLCDGASSIKEAEKAESAFKYRTLQQQNGIIPRQDTKVKMTVIFNLFENYSRLNKKSYVSDKHMLSVLRGYFKDKNAQGVTAKSLEDLKDYLLNKRRLKNSTVNRYSALLSKAFNLGIANKLIKENPVSFISKLKEQNFKVRFLTREEEARLFKFLPEYLKPIVTTALQTGMRRGEILGLKWSNIDFEYRFIELLETKSGKSRKIPISDKLMDIFEKLPKVSEYVFVNAETNKPYKDIKKSWKKALKEAHIENFRFHDLRHTVATRLAESNIDLVVVKEILGHADIQTTMRYAHAVPKRKQDAISVLNSYS